MIAQACSAVWVLAFLTGKKAVVRLERGSLGLDDCLIAAAHQVKEGRLEEIERRRQPRPQQENRDDDNPAGGGD